MERPNPIGEWIDRYCESTGTGIRDLGKRLEMPGIGPLRQKPADEVSVYAMAILLEGTEMLGCSQDQINGLVDAVCETVEYTMQSKGRLYTRIPPTVARAKQKNLSESTFTPTQLVQELGFSMSKIETAKKNLGIDSLLVTGVDVARLKIHLQEVNQGTELTEGLPVMIASVSGANEHNFVSVLKQKTGLSLSGLRRIKVGENPNPEEFGLILEKLDPTQEQIELMVDRWLTSFRSKLTYADLAREFGISRERVRQLAKGLKGNSDPLTWDEVEQLRKERSGEAKKAKATKPREAREKSLTKKNRGRSGKNGVGLQPRVRPDVIQPAHKSFDQDAYTQENPKDQSKNIEAIYPNVITDYFLEQLMPSERSAAIKLRGSSYSNPITADKLDSQVLNYLVRERIFPQGAKIRIKNDSGGFYLEYT